MDDHELVQACLAGRDGAWERFSERTRPLIAALVRRRLARFGLGGDDHLVDDLVSEVHLSLIEDDGRLLRRYDPTYSLSTWLGVLVRTRVNRHLRKSRPSTRARPDWTEDLSDDEADDALDRLCRKDARRLVRRLLDRLSPRDRRVLRLFYMDDASYREIAEALDCSENSVGPILHRARGRLRRLAEKRGRDALGSFRLLLLALLAAPAA